MVGVRSWVLLQLGFSQHWHKCGGMVASWDGLGIMVERWQLLSSGLQLIW